MQNIHSVTHVGSSKDAEVSDIQIGTVLGAGLYTSNSKGK